MPNILIATFYQVDKKNNTIKGKNPIRIENVTSKLISMDNIKVWLYKNFTLMYVFGNNPAYNFNTEKVTYVNVYVFANDTKKNYYFKITKREHGKLLLGSSRCDIDQIEFGQEIANYKVFNKSIDY